MKRKCGKPTVVPGSGEAEDENKSELMDRDADEEAAAAEEDVAAVEKDEGTDDEEEGGPEKHDFLAGSGFFRFFLKRNA